MVRVETITPTLFQVGFKGLWMFYVVFFSTSLHQPSNTSLIDFPLPPTSLPTPSEVLDSSVHCLCTVATRIPRSVGETEFVFSRKNFRVISVRASPNSS